MKKSLILDSSPIFYRWLFSSTTHQSQKLKLEKDENGVYDFDQYKDIYIYQVLDYISKQKIRFGVDEVILGVDSSPYWRKEHWSGYKFGRRKNDESGIDWKKAGEIQKEIINLLKENSTYKVIDIKGVEGDDVLFVLSEELSKRGHEVIVHSLDHDINYVLLHDNVKYWRTKYNSPTKECGFSDMSEVEILREMYFHKLTGDKGDYILHCKSYTQFSEEFIKEYGDKITPLKAWPKRHEIDLAFIEKFKDKYPEKYEKNKLSAYKHPSFGDKMWMKRLEKGEVSLNGFLEENPIHKLNYELNELLSMPYKIPDKIKNLIIEEYDTQSIDLNIGMLVEYFNKYNIFNLIGRVGLF